MASEDILKILGGRKNLQPGASMRSGGRASRTDADRPSPASLSTRFVLKIEALRAVSARLEYPEEDLLSILNVTGRTAQRRQMQGVLSEDESDRLYRIARVTELAERVFASTEKARAWLKKVNPALHGDVPLQLLTTDAGAELVTDELTRIDYGDLY